MLTLNTVESYRPCLQTVFIAFFVMLLFVVNRVGAQTGWYVLYLPFSFEGGILIFMSIIAAKLWDGDMDKKTAFIGHRKVYYEGKVKERLEAAITEQIKNGCKSFIMGTHGEFDSLALSCCRKARDTYPDIEIDVVLTSYHTVEKKDEFDYVPYQDVNTFMYDIEDEHFKRQIIVSNRKMMDDCDRLICYVDKKQSPSGAKMAMNYAKRKGLKIINLFREDDDPTFYMTEEERKAYWDNLFAEFRKT